MSESLETRIYQKLIEETERESLRRAIWRGSGNKFVVVDAREKASQVAELVRKYLQETRQ